MKKSKKIKKVPACAFGAQDMMGYGELAGGIGDMIGGLSGEDSAGSMIGAGVSGIGKGVAMGAAAGPIGMIAGGAIGGFTSLFGAAKRRRAIREAKARKAQMKLTQAGLANQAVAEQDYWEDNSPVYTFENGGILPDLAYLDNNEVVRDDFGNIEQVPNSKPGTDNHLVDASNLESVLSDKIKRPGTNKTFAQEGKKLANMTKGSKGKDRFARNADKLNKINANTMYEQLLDEQEIVKAKKGIKPKVKGIPAYEDGKGKVVRFGDVRQTYNYSVSLPDGTRVRILDDGTMLDANGLAIGKPKSISAKDTFTNVANTKVVTPKSKPRPVAVSNNSNAAYNAYGEQLMNDMMQSWNPEYGDALANAATVDRDRSIRRMYNRDVNSVAGHGRTLGPGIGYGANDWYRPTTVDGITGETILVNTPEQVQVEAPTNLALANIDVPAPAPVTKTLSSTPVAKKSSNSVTAKSAPVDDWEPEIIMPKSGVAKPLDYIHPNVEQEEEIGTWEKPKSNKPGALNFDFSSLTGLSPILYNFAQSLKKPEYEETVLNPYAAASMRAMAKRRLNIEPTLAANRRNRAINRNNMARLNPNTGMNLAYGNQLATSEYSRNADVYAARDNANNQYLADYANMGNNFGQQFVQAQTLANDLNARNRAAARNFGSTAAGQLGQWTQTKEQMRNQYNRDMMLLPFYEDFLKYGTSSDKVNNLMKSVKKR